jgi:hypothetical protein
VRTRFLPIFFGVVFALMLFFAVAAGAKEEGTDPEGVGVQAVEVQQQQDLDNQQQVTEVQQQQVLNNQGQAVAVQQQQVEVQSHRGCPGSRTRERVEDPEGSFQSGFDVTGEAIRITYDVIAVGPGPNPDDELFIRVTDEDDDEVVYRVSVNGERQNTRRIEVDPGRFTLEVEAGKDVLDYEVLVQDCTRAEANHDDGGDGDGDGDGGGDGGTGDGTTDGTGTTDTTTETTTTQDTTDTTTDTTDTTTSGTTGDALETTTADNADSVRDADAFRCDFFLRAVRDDTGALRGQYRGDELIVQRFEQCLSEDVLADSIPDRKPPFTGGPSLPFGGGLLLLVASAVLAGRIIRR